MLYRWAFSLLTLVVLLSVVSAAIAQEKLRLAWAGFSPTNSPIWVMEDRKLLQKQGVTPEIIAINASPTVLQALLANEIEAASISVTTLTSSRLAGADTVMIFGIVPTFVDHIVSLSSVTAVEQLKGKTAGVNRLGSTSDLGLRLALKKLGIDPDKDVKIIPTGGHGRALRGVVERHHAIYDHTGTVLNPGGKARLPQSLQHQRSKNSVLVERHPFS
jgi:NitT/TauT family transport system substrate-binding protein